MASSSVPRPKVAVPRWRLRSRRTDAAQRGRFTAQAAKLIKGGGGKDPLLAVAGGKDPAGLDAALDAARAALAR